MDTPQIKTQDTPEDKIPIEDRACFFLAKTATEKCRGRSIVTWLYSARFERVLRTYFNRHVAYSVSMVPEKCNGSTVRLLGTVSPADCYLVILDRDQDAGTEKILADMGFNFASAQDCIYMRHKTVVLENFRCGGTGDADRENMAGTSGTSRTAETHITSGMSRYTDMYGNSITAPEGTSIRKVVFHGCGNRICIGRGVSGTANISLDVTGNSTVHIGDGCTFSGPVRMEVYGYSGSASIRIGEHCRFTDALFRVYASPYESAIIINPQCTFETHYEAHANTGKRIILGRDCMVSHNVYMLAGDGHPIYDVHTGKNINSDFIALAGAGNSVKRVAGDITKNSTGDSAENGAGDSAESRSNSGTNSGIAGVKNNLVLGDHVWCGYGAFIMNGTNIGTGSIIGAECVVKGVYGNNVCIAGNPAKVTRTGCAWARNMDAPDIHSIDPRYVAETIDPADTKSPVSGQDVLIIGGTGFSGIRLVQRLLSLGNRVTIATRGKRHDTYGDAVHRLVLDVTDYSSVHTALAGRSYDIVMDDLAYNPVNVYNVLCNVQTKRYIQLSSVMAYGMFHMDMKEEELDLEHACAGLEGTPDRDWTTAERDQAKDWNGEQSLDWGTDQTKGNNRDHCKGQIPDQPMACIKAHTNEHLKCTAEDWVNAWTKQSMDMDPHRRYVLGKRYAECMAYMLGAEKGISVVTVRIPYVWDRRIEYYCRHIAEDKTMHIKDPDRRLVFVRDTDVGSFLPWIAAQDYTGPINFADTGTVSVREIIQYISGKCSKKVPEYAADNDTNMPGNSTASARDNVTENIAGNAGSEVGMGNARDTDSTGGTGSVYITEDTESEPFNEYGETSFTLNLDRLKSLGYRGADLKDWLWKSIDWYIKRTLSTQGATGTQPVVRTQAEVHTQPAAQSGKGEQTAKDTVPGTAQDIDHLISFWNKDTWNRHAGTMLSLDADKCTGCLACYNACPENAIRIITDSRGYIVPGIDSAKCIHCGKCKRTCPRLNLVFPYPEQTQCFAYMATDDIRKVSASGGVFLPCAEYVLANGGVVAGAAWTEEYGLQHIIITDKSQLRLLYGTRYVQSCVGDTYREVKRCLEDGRQVLFAGTPCQADGLRHYLKKDYPKLYIIDLLCRGVPSAEMFKRYLHESYGDEKLKSVAQKSKRPYGWGAYTEIVHESGATEYYSMENNIWMKAYLSDFMFRDSCYSCPYTQKKRTGDLSIGDFWQVARYNGSFDDRLGTSLVIANTAKGRELLKHVSAMPCTKLCEKVPLDFELPYNSALHTVRKVPEGRELFFDMLQRAPLGAALDRALYGKKYDIGIVGWWSNLNYGGTLTYYALYQTIQRLGYSVMMIRPPYSGAAIPPEDTVPMRFARKHYAISRIYAHRDMHLLNYACKGFVSGSDQLWNPWLEQYAGKECFLSFANSNSLRISYASSFGNVSSFDETFTAKYKPELKKFDAISVREDYAVILAKQYFDTDAQFVCDPVFLCTRQDYVALAGQSSCGFPKKFTLNFILDPDDSKSKAIMYIAERKRCRYVCFTDLQDTEKRKAAFNLPAAGSGGGREKDNDEDKDNAKDTHRGIGKGIGNDKGITTYADGAVYANHAVEDLLKAYEKCDFVVTDSYHGTCFAIIFNKPFICIANHKRGERRFESLLTWTGLTGRMVNSADEIYDRPKLLEDIDYSAVSESIAKFRDSSLEWLKTALKKMKY